MRRAYVLNEVNTVLGARSSESQDGPLVSFRVYNQLEEPRNVSVVLLEHLEQTPVVGEIDDR
jgi:hypothetical protein